VYVRLHPVILNFKSRAFDIRKAPVIGASISYDKWNIFFKLSVRENRNHGRRKIFDIIYIYI